MPITFRNIKNQILQRPPVPIPQLHYFDIIPRIFFNHDVARRIDFGEMKEFQERASGAAHAVCPDLSFPGADIPTRHVVAGITLDIHTVKKARDKIAPFLIGEYSVRDVVIAGEVKLLRPPVCELVADGIVAHRAKTQIVDAVFKRSQLVVLDEAFAFVGRYLVGRQNDRILVQLSDNAVQVGEDDDVGVEVHDLLHSLIEQVTEHLAFDGSGCLNNVMLEQPAFKSGKIQVLCVKDMIELAGQSAIVSVGWLVGNDGP